MKNISLLKEKYKRHVFNILDINTSIFNFVYDVNLFRNSKSIRFLETFYRTSSKYNANDYRGLILLDNKLTHVSFINDNHKIIVSDQFHINDTGNKLISYYSSIYSPFENFVIKPNILLSEDNILFLIEENINYKFYLCSVKDVSDEFILENLDFFKNNCINFYSHPLSEDIYLPFSYSEIDKITLELTDYFVNKSNFDLFHCLEIINQKVKNTNIKQNLYNEFLTCIIQQKHYYRNDVYKYTRDFFTNNENIINLIESGYTTVKDIFSFDYILENFANKFIAIGSESIRYNDNEKIDSLIFKQEDKNEIKDILYSILKYRIVKSNNKYSLFKMNFYFNNVLTNINNISDLQPNIFNIIFELLVFELFEEKTNFFKNSEITNNKLLFLFLCNNLGITRDDLIKNYDNISKISSLEDVFSKLNKLAVKNTFYLINLNLLNNKVLLNDIVTKLRENSYEISLEELGSIPEYLSNENINYIINHDINKFNLYQRFYDCKFTSLVFQHLVDKEVIQHNFISSLNYISDKLYLTNIIEYYTNYRIIIEEYNSKLLNLPILEIKIITPLFKFYNCLGFDIMFDYINVYSNNQNLDVKIVIEELLFNSSLNSNILQSLVVKYINLLNNLSQKYEFIMRIFKHNDDKTKKYFHIEIIDILNYLVEVNIFTVNDIHILIHKYYKENRKSYNKGYFNEFNFSINYYYLDILLNTLNLDDRTKYLRETKVNLDIDTIYTIILSKNENIYHLLLNPNENFPFRKKEFNEKLIEIFIEKKWNLLHLLVYINFITPNKNSKQLIEFVTALYKSKNFNIINNFNVYTYINLEYININKYIDLNIVKLKHKTKTLNDLFSSSSSKCDGFIANEYIFKFNETLNKVVTSNK